MLGVWAGRHSFLLCPKASTEYEMCLSQDGEYELCPLFVSEISLLTWGTPLCREVDTDTVSSLCPRTPKFLLFSMELKHLSSLVPLWPVGPGSSNSQIQIYRRDHHDPPRDKNWIPTGLYTKLALTNSVLWNIHYFSQLPPKTPLTYSAQL